MSNLNELIVQYALDTENVCTNFPLALEYDSLGQTAAAISFYLRTADRTDDKVLAYSCMIKTADCFDRQKNRDDTVRGLLRHAITLLPERPEAYWNLARYEAWFGNYDQVYMLCTLAENICDFESYKLPGNVYYLGIGGFQYYKALGAWYWGKIDEFKSNIEDCYHNNMDDLDDFHKGKIEEEINNIKMRYPDSRPTGYVQHDIVLQGPIELDTHQTVDEYLKLPFVKDIIISTWEGEEFNYDNPRVRVVHAQKPLWGNGTCNRNLQIVGSQRGLQEVTTEYAIRMRTDQRYSYDSMMLMYQFYIDEGGLDNGKMFVPAVYPNFLFHPRDHMFWSTTNNLKTLFDIPLEKESIQDKVSIGKMELFHYHNHFVRTETYIGAHYLSKYDDSLKMYLLYPDKYLHDNSEGWQEAHQKSEHLMKTYFKSFPREGVDLVWMKRMGKEYRYDEQKQIYNECWHEDGV